MIFSFSCRDLAQRIQDLWKKLPKVQAKNQRLGRNYPRVRTLNFENHRRQQTRKRNSAPIWVRLCEATRRIQAMSLRPDKAQNREQQPQEVNFPTRKRHQNERWVNFGNDYKGKRTLWLVSQTEGRCELVKISSLKFQKWHRDVQKGE